MKFIALFLCAGLSLAAAGQQNPHPDNPVYHVGGSITSPTLISRGQDPQYSPEAIKAGFSGSVEVYLIVDQRGDPTHVQVVKPVGMGLDEKAVEAVHHYKFQPGMKDGMPVRIDFRVQVTFQ